MDDVVGVGVVVELVGWFVIVEELVLVIVWFVGELFVLVVWYGLVWYVVFWYLVGNLVVRVYLVVLVGWGIIVVEYWLMLWVSGVNVVLSVVWYISLYFCVLMCCYVVLCGSL